LRIEWWKSLWSPQGFLGVQERFGMRANMRNQRRKLWFGKAGGGLCKSSFVPTMWIVGKKFFFRL